MNAIQKKETSIVEYMAQETVATNIRETLGEKAPQFIASVAALVNSDRALATADKKTVLLACLTAAVLDLPINANLGFAYVIPYKDKAQFQMGYKGFIQLALRSGKFQRINVTDVREGEIQDMNRLTGEIEYQWVKEGRDKLPVVGYVAYMRLNTGFEKSLYMTKEELKAHGAKYSQAAKKGYGLWTDEFDAMASKTVVKLLLSKYGLLTTQLQTAVLADQAVVEDRGKYKYIDNAPVDATEVAGEKEKARILKHIKDAKSEKSLLLAQDAVKTSGDKELQDAFDKKLHILRDKDLA